MFLFKLKVWNYIQEDFIFDPFSLWIYELSTFYPRINKDDYFYISSMHNIDLNVCPDTKGGN